MNEELNESEFTRFIEFMQACAPAVKYFHMSPAVAAQVRSGGGFETEGFRLVETKPNWFELVERDAEP